MILKKIYVLILLSTSVISYAMNTSKTAHSPSPAMHVHNKYYFEVELPKAAFGKNKKEIIGSNLQHGGKYVAVKNNDSQNKRFGRGSSGNNAKL